MSLYKHKYRIESVRWRGYDYAQPGFYFVTVCTAGRRHYFGAIRNGSMVPSQVGKIVQQEIDSLSSHHPVRVDSSVVMPNHLHLLILLNSLCIAKAQPGISPKPQSLGAIVRSFKSAVTKGCNEAGLEHKWQARFYDRVVRSQKEYDRIFGYIVDNPLNWAEDEYFSVET